MGRQAKLGQKNGYWYSEAGGKGRYYGRVGVVSHAEATRALRESLVAPLAEPVKAPVVTVPELIDLFLDWMAKNREPATTTHRRYQLRHWKTFVGNVDATSITGKEIEKFRAFMESQNYSLDYIKRHFVAIQHMYRRGARMKWIPACNPFCNIDPIKIPTRPFYESNLLTPLEIDALFAAASTTVPPLEDILRVYYSTGARTGELFLVKVGDFQPRTRSLLLGKHKRSNTLKRDETRQITLNDTAYEIVSRNCAGRAADEPIFPYKGRIWTGSTMAKKFRPMRILAGVRPSITIYSFRHLWISEMLMAGVDILLVARMAGTSVMMVERVYGHFRSITFQDAQARLDAARERRST